MQPDQYSQPEIQPPTPDFTPERKSGGLPIFGISMSVLSLFLLCIIVGVGYWAYTLNTRLTATTDSLNALQAEHDILKADYAALQGDNTKLSSDIAALQAELETTKNDLTTAQASLKSEQEHSAALQTKIDDALTRVNVIVSFYIEEKTPKGVEADIRETRDTKLLDLYQEYISSYSLNDFDNWFTYLIESIVEALSS